ncbi:hypothetical protein [Streptomyces sp. NPDC048187]|uniref:hypothetical protein n=1 Tax=Streptomyces sp. NPDC048187 TaxID=3365509 RepID=UPI0037125CFF
MSPRRRWWLLPGLQQGAAATTRGGVIWHWPLLAVPAATLQAYAVLYMALHLDHLDGLFLEDNGMFAMCAAVMVFALTFRPAW